MSKYSECSIQNFKKWKTMTGIDQQFPKLNRIENMVEFIKIDELLDGVRETIASNIITVIKVKPGWGATSLFKYLEDTLRSEGKYRRDIIITMDFETSGKIPKKSEFLHEIKWQILGEILYIAEFHTLDSTLQNNIINHKENKDGLSFDEYLLECRGLQKELRTDSYSFLKRYPFFEQNIDTIINHLLKSLGLITSIYYLFDTNTLNDDIIDFEQTLKDLFEEKGGAEGFHFEDATKKEIFICTPQIANWLFKTFRRAKKDINYRQYYQNEIYFMLERRYKAENLHSKGLSNIFSEKIVSNVYDKDITIKDIINKIEDWIHAELDCDANQVKVRLELTKGQP